MPKPKKKKETPQEQARRFQSEVEKLAAAGELSPTEAEEALDSLVRKAKQISHSLACMWSCNTGGSLARCHCGLTHRLSSE